MLHKNVVFGDFVRCILTGILVTMLPFSCSETASSKSAKIAFSDSTYYYSFSGDSLSITWDDPNTVADSVKFYQLYYRTAANLTWTKIRDSLKTNKAVVYRKNLASTDSIFVFGTRSVNVYGKQSEIHASADLTASPPNWGIFWK